MNKQKKIEELSELISSFVPEDGRASIFATFGSFNRNEVGCVLSGLEIVLANVSPADPNKSADIINAIMVGSMISILYDNPETKKIIFDKFIGILKSHSGDNIIDFCNFKNKRLL